MNKKFNIFYYSEIIQGFIVYQIKQTAYKKNRFTTLQLRQIHGHQLNWRSANLTNCGFEPLRHIYRLP